MALTDLLLLIACVIQAFSCVFLLAKTRSQNGSARPGSSVKICLIISIVLCVCSIVLFAFLKAPVFALAFFIVALAAETCAFASAGGLNFSARPDTDDQAPQETLETEQDETREKYENLTELVKNFVVHVQDTFEDKINMGKLLDYINQAAIDYFHADGGVVFLVDDYEDIISAKSFFGTFPPPYKLPDDLPHKPLRIETNFKYIQMPFGESIFGEVVVTGKPIFIADGSNDARVYQNGPEEFLIPGSYIAAPLKVKEKIIGVASLAKKHDSAPFSEEDFHMFCIAAKFASIAIDNVNAFGEVVEQSDIEHEAEIAANIQKTLLPARLPELEGVNFGSFFLPAKGVCGDYYDIILARKDRIGLAIGDVAGKGIQSCVVMVMIRALLHLITNTTKDSATILDWINKGIIGDIDMDRYASLVFASLNIEDKTIEISNASHQPALVWRSETSNVEKYAAESDPLGVERGSVYENLRLTIQDGDIIILYTDGIVEALDAEGRQYGIDRLASVIENNNQLSARELANKIKQDVQTFCGNVRQHDDQTLLAVKFNQ